MGVFLGEKRKMLYQRVSREDRERIRVSKGTEPLLYLIRDDLDSLIRIRVAKAEGQMAATTDLRRRQPGDTRPTKTIIAA